MYKAVYPEINVKIKLHKNDFKSNINLEFAVPHSYSCKYSDKFYAKKILLSQNCSLHTTILKNSETAEINPNLVILFVDLRQVLFCPTLLHSDIFHQRQCTIQIFVMRSQGLNIAEI
jgi:hypothetical protein